MAERVTVNHLVVGSSPTSGAIFIKAQLSLIHGGCVFLFCIDGLSLYRYLMSCRSSGLDLDEDVYAIAIFIDHIRNPLDRTNYAIHAFA